MNDPSVSILPLEIGDKTKNVGNLENEVVPKDIVETKVPKVINEANVVPKVIQEAKVVSQDTDNPYNTVAFKLLLFVSLMVLLSVLMIYLKLKMKN